MRFEVLTAVALKKMASYLMEYEAVYFGRCLSLFGGTYFLLLRCQRVRQASRVAADFVYSGSLPTFRKNIMPHLYGQNVIRASKQQAEQSITSHNLV
jgi:hypothetical protein